MFGSVVANLDKLSPEDTERYRSYYCGLCKALGERHGTLSRITINYDMTFFIIFISSLYKREFKSGTERCIVHPGKKHTFLINQTTDYAADINIALAYYNFMDDWMDDKKPVSIMSAKLLKREYTKVSEKYPEQCASIQKSLEELSLIERSGELNPDIPANCFGKLLEEITAVQEDEYSGKLRGFINSLGRFIYIMDACIDLRQDIKKERYNPMVATPSDSFSNILNLLMADCTEKYSLLPINQDKNIIDNILYSGIWTKYTRANNKKRESEKK